MECFKQFIKYNPQLIELDLSNCKLNNAAILYLAYCLTRAQSLRVLHLCGNMSRPRDKTIQEDFGDKKQGKSENPNEVLI